MNVSNTCFVYSVSQRINLIGRPYIYPCLESRFSLLVSNIHSIPEDDVRLIRLFYSDVLTNDVRKLQYVREYHLPGNNLLVLNCNSVEVFDPRQKFHCFQFVARSQSTQAVTEMSEPSCISTIHTNDSQVAHNQIDLKGTTKVKGLLGRLEIPERAGRHEDREDQNIYQKTRQDERNRILPPDQYSICSCVQNESGDPPPKIISNSKSIVIFANCSRPSSSPQEKLFRHQSSYNVVRQNHSYADSSDSMNNVMNRGLFVCLLESSFLSDSESRRVKIVNMVRETSKESGEKSNFDERGGGNEMRVRDGMLSVDPLISLTTHESQPLHSKFIRIEFWNGPVMLSLDFETTNFSQVKPQYDSYGQKDHSVTEMIYYALFAFTIASFIGGFIFVCICLNLDRRRARKERHKRRQERLERQQEEGSCVQASEESSSEEGDAFRPERPEISQIVLEGDGVSLEMDYYDYYHNELIAKKEKKQDEDSQEPTSAVTSFQS